MLACTPLVRNISRALKSKAQNNNAVGVIWGVLHTVLPVALLGLSVLALVGNSYNPFLYFQF